jgi:hypothetical protein
MSSPLILNIISVGPVEVKEFPFAACRKGTSFPFLGGERGDYQTSSY